MKTELKILFALGAVFAVVLPRVFAGAIPGPGTNRIFLFASPSTQEMLNDGDARARLTSFEQINATAVADRAACSLTHSVRIAGSLGIYAASSENSFIVEANLDRKPSEYLAALLGLYSRQEFILLFFENAGGGDSLWIVKTPQSMQVVSRALRGLNLTPVTVRIEKDRNEIWFVDIGEKRAQDLNLLTLTVKGQASVTAGVAEMLGNRSRATAVNEWRQQIAAFERQSGDHLSQLLSSNGWRRATTVHTCSKELSIP